MGSKEVFENVSINKVVLCCFYFSPGTKKKVGKFSRRILLNNLTSLRGSNREYGMGGGNPFQCSCLEDPMDRGAWQTTVHGVARESDMTWPLNNKNREYR